MFRGAVGNLKMRKNGGKIGWVRSLLRVRGGSLKRAKYGCFKVCGGDGGGSRKGELGKR